MEKQKIFFVILIIFALGVAVGLVVFISGMDLSPSAPVQNSVKAPSGEIRNDMPNKKTPPLGRGDGICQDLCGNGKCEEVVCMGEGCPCAETAVNCPADCN